MDDIDLQDQREAMLLEARIKARKPVGPIAIGKCLWCEAAMEDKTKRWCDSDCRDDFVLAEQNAPHLIP